MANRTPQPIGKKGSLKWVQMLINDHPHLLSEAVGTVTGISPESIEWVSPLAADAYAEYRDQGFLDRLDLVLNRNPLSAFWPARGPQWDALGKGERQVILIEAKAHIGELISPASQASPISLTRIRASLGLVKAALGVSPDTEWAGRYYQYANRLAHLYQLHHLNDIPAHLVNVCFLNDVEMRGPATVAEWEAGIGRAHRVLGLQEHPLLRNLHHVFIDVRALSPR